MATRKLERSEWRRYFDEVAKRLPTMRVTVLVLDDHIGVQPETEEGTLIGVTFDPKDGILEVATPNITHRVSDPKEIYVQEERGQLASIEVLVSDGTKRIFELKPLPALPTS
jgi:hypothetical protein